MQHELDDGTRAIRTRKLARRTSDTETVCVFASALWAGSTNKNGGVEPPRRVQHEFVGVREVGISTLLAAIRDMHGRCNFPVESHQFVCAPVKTRRDARISIVFSELPARVSIVNFKCRQESAG